MRWFFGEYTNCRWTTCLYNGQRCLIWCLFIRRPDLQWRASNTYYKYSSCTFTTNRLLDEDIM